MLSEPRVLDVAVQWQDGFMSDAIPDFASIYAAFQPKVLRYLKGLVGPDEAEDISQNVFLKVQAGLKDFRGKASLSTWIYRIATNAALDRLRNRSFRQATQFAADTVSQGCIEDEGAINDAADDTVESSAESLFMRREMNECIANFVEGLPENYRTVLALSDLDGLKNQEIADILGLSVDTVKIRLHRARRALKKQFATKCNFYRTEANELACDRKAPGRSSTP
jgi:RNA polymerase sigma-70 factor (ECF subfamily)